MVRDRRGSRGSAREARELTALAPGTAHVPAAGRLVVPVGPLDARPSGVCRADALLMLAAVLDGLPRGSGDRSLLARVEAHWDAADIVILASWVATARLEDSPAGEVVALAAGPQAGWGVTCGPCGVRLVPGPVALDTARVTARSHDVEEHGGAWIASCVPVTAQGRPAAVVDGDSW